jgi:hypothetical protein
MTRTSDADGDRTQPKRRTGRTVQRPNTEATRLTERDRWVLEALTKMRFLTTTQAARLFFGASRSAANKRLRRLLDAGLARAWVRSLSEDNVYSITRAGLDALRVDETGIDGHPQVPCRLDGNLDHLLAINTVRIALALALPESGGELRWWRSDWELPRAGRRVTPDTLFAVRWDGGAELACSLEVERHTSGPRTVLTKLLRYVAQRTAAPGVSGGADGPILVVGHDPRRLERCRAALGHLRLPVPVWFATLRDLDAGASGDIWQPLHGANRCSLRDLCSLPYGTEGFSRETDGAPDRSTSERAGIYPSTERQDSWPTGS